WYAWMPRMGQEFRVVRPDLPGLGRSRIPAGFEWTLPSLAAFVARVLDKAGVDTAHIIGAKAGGAIATQFAADYPARTRTLSVIPNSRLVVLRSDGYHIAASNAEECVTNVLAFITEAKHKR